MYLSSRVGTPMKPADAGGLPAKAQRVFDFAVLSAGCPDPVIVMNELFGASTADALDADDRPLPGERARSGRAC